jgi:hypothetical protein
MTRGRKRAAVVLASVFYAMTSIASAQTVWDKSYDAALKE